MSARDGGSAMLEAVVAVAITAGVMGAAMQATASVHARQIQTAARRSALLIARSELDAVGAEIPLAPGETEGRQGDFVWRVRIEPMESQALAVSRAGAAQRVTVAVRPAGGAGDLIVLKTLRLASP
jgi:hypothetical protein